MVKLTVVPVIPRSAFLGPSAHRGRDSSRRQFIQPKKVIPQTVPRFLPTFIDGPPLSSLHSGAENHVIVNRAETSAGATVITVANRAATGVETAPFQNQSRNDTCERLIFQHPSRAILAFQKDLFLETGRRMLRLTCRNCPSSRYG
jgi:hypothetical protein